MQPGRTGGIVASRRFNEALLERRRASGRGEQIARGDPGSEESVHAGLGKLVSNTGTDEVIVVTDTYEHSARIESYQRVVRIARNIELAQSR